MSKRRARGGAGGVQSAVSQLVVKHRELNDNERKAQVRFPIKQQEDFLLLLFLHYSLQIRLDLTELTVHEEERGTSIVTNIVPFT